MNDWFQTLFLALVQGLTEFLPISSSAHLVIPPMLLGWTDRGLSFDVAVHIGTLGAVLVYFRRDLSAMARAFIRAPLDRSDDDCQMVWCLILATLPVALVGFFASGFIESYLRNIEVIAFTTALFGLLLGMAERRARVTQSHRAISPWRALVIGMAQALAPVPGVSRSGITITAALFLDMDRQSAARFSFLLSIPAIAGAGLFKGVQLAAMDEPVTWSLILVPALFSALVAYMTIAWFLRLLDRVGLMPFVWYRLALSVCLLLIWRWTEWG